MRTGEVVGGAALIGAAALVGIALTDDGAPEVITTDTSPFVFDSSPTTITSTTSTVPAAGSTASEPARTTSDVASTTAETEPAPTEPTVPPSPPITLIPPEQRGGIAVRVLNGGAAAGAATSMSGVLRGAGFAPAGPADTQVTVAATTVLFAPGRELEAATVNDVVKARPENVVMASPGDPNWAEFGDGLAVLVVLGPAGT